MLPDSAQAEPVLLSACFDAYHALVILRATFRCLMISSSALGSKHQTYFDASCLTSRAFVMSILWQHNRHLGSSTNHTLGASNQATEPTTEPHTAINGIPAASSCPAARAACIASAVAGRPGRRPAVIMRIKSASAWAAALLLALASAEAQLAPSGAAASGSPATAAAAASAAQAAAAAEAIVASTAVDPAAAAASASTASASAAAAATEVPSPLPAGSPALPTPVAAQPPPPAVEPTVSVPPPFGGSAPPPGSTVPLPPQAPSPPVPPPPLGAQALT